MTKMSKTKINARRKEQSAERKVKSAQRQLSHAQMEAQIAALEAKIALLTEEGIGKFSQGKFSQGNREEVKTESLAPLEKSPILKPQAFPTPQARAKLSTPVLDNVTAVGPRLLRVSWYPVANAIRYLVQWSPEESFESDLGALTVDASATSTNLSGLRGNTLYHVRVQALAGEGDADSAFSQAKSATTGIASDETATLLQNWLEQLQTLNRHFLTLLPQTDGEVLSPAERKRLLGSGVRRYGYIDKVSDTSEAYPQFWPASVQGTDGNIDMQDKLKDRLREIEVLRNLLIAFRFGSRVAEDMLLTAGDEAFRMANLYYRSVREAARGNLPEADDVFQMLRLFWHRPRRISDEPTIPTELFGRSTDIERDVNALLHGRKNGTVSITHESPTTSGGVHEVIDNVRR